MIKKVGLPMKNSRVELNILEIMITINKMVMENMFGLMGRAIKEIG